jgi:hypothetical protein
MAGKGTVVKGLDRNNTGSKGPCMSPTKRAAVEKCIGDELGRSGAVLAVGRARLVHSSICKHNFQGGQPTC